MGTLAAFVLTSLAVPILRTRHHPDLKSARSRCRSVRGARLPDTGSAVTALVPDVLPAQVGNPLVWGFFPLVWLWFLIWLAIGLAFYFIYGRHKSTVALEEAAGLAVEQPRVN